jgi:hypothetical protein
MLNHSAWMWNTERRHIPGDELIVLLAPALSVRCHGGRIAETGAIIQPEEWGFDLVDSCRTPDRWPDLKIAICAWPPARESGGRMLEIAACFPFSPSAFQASLQTSIFQERNRTTGTAMSLIKKSDVKNHLSPRYRTKIHLCRPASQPDATGYSVAEPDAIKANPSDFAEDFVVEHSSSATSPAPADLVTGSIRPRASTGSKSAKA